MATNNNKALNIALWVVQVFVGLGFLIAGVMKTTQPIEELGKSLPWVTQVSAGLVRFVGISELLGGLGVLLPSILRIKPNLTPLAALGLVVIMVLAFIFHVVKAEYSVLMIPLIMGALAYFIYWGRTKKSKILPRS
ncbi:DoxX family protein [Chryseobacterium indologenes]|uniref:DoxX family protein n=1 Tax=Chryseobacterium indologenes TaxID=253 RepID=UPI0023E75633|nr:DoxX family protein [Chryseobacterium indologenes]WET50791.1 DoxX family protein [Chryseobacterium indologenes]